MNTISQYFDDKQHDTTRTTLLRRDIQILSVRFPSLIAARCSVCFADPVSTCVARAGSIFGGFLIGLGADTLAQQHLTIAITTTNITCLVSGDDQRD